MKPQSPARAPAAGYQAAVGGLVDRPWLHSTAYRDRVRFTDLTRAVRPVAELVKKLQRRAAKMGIPLECLSAVGPLAVIVHSRRGRELAPLEWEVIGHLGAEISEQYCLHVRWCGPSLPDRWEAEGYLLF